jgi:tetratricopeptide (TPR) repeat protein
MNGHMPIRLLSRALLLLLFAISGGMPALGQGVPQGYPNDPRYGFDPREVALLPRYCLDAQVFRASIAGHGDARAIERWTSIMGSSYNNIHHYCWGLMHTNRALFLVRTERWRKSYLEASIGEFDYVIARAPDDFVLLPEILTKKCENLSRLDRGPQAERECERAIALKPDYWPAYAAMSAHYATIDDTSKAREWLEKGLSVTPDVEALKRRLAELDADKGRRTPALRSAAAQRPAER